MNTQEFLRLILPPQGKHFFIVTIAPSGRPSHYHTTNIDNAAHCATKRDQDSDGNVYYGMASYKEASYDDNGKKRKRTQKNVDQLNCFWIDLDCKGREGDRDYPSQREALLDVKNFRDATGIPRPTVVVNSGYGLHMYWVLEEAISGDEWARVADDWRATLDRHGVKHDSSCTTDSARILRPIGTHNKKTGQESREVTLLGSVGDRIKLEDFVRPLACKSALVMQPLQMMSPGVDMELNALAESAVEYPPSSIKEIIKGCALMREVGQLGGNVSYDLWRGALGIIKHTVEAGAAAPIFSRKHKDYTAEATLAKMESWEAGPATCEFMARSAISDRIDVCSKCAHRGGVKSPIQLGYDKTPILTEAVSVPVVGGDPITTIQEVPAMPPSMDDFKWEHGHLVRYVVDKEAAKKSEQGTKPEKTPVRLCGHMFFPSRYYLDENEKHQMVWTVREYEGVYRDFTLAGSAIGTGGANLFKELGEAGVTSTGTAAKPHLEAYISKWVNEIKRQQKGSETFTRFGWHGNDFLHGDTMYCRSGEIKKVRLAGGAVEIGRFLKPSGSLDKWKALIDEAYNHHGAEAYQFAICAGFGSLLMPFMNVAGGPVISSTSYTSGRGKTTAARNAFGIYGDPGEKSKATLSSSSATQKAVFAVAGILHNYPVIVDEITNSEGMTLSDTIYTWSQGQTRIGLLNTGELRKSGPGWSGVMLSTSNMPVLNIVAGVKPTANAEVMRLIEYDCSDTHRLDKDIADRVFMELKQNYGVAAEVFIPWLVQNLDEAKETLRDTQRSLDKRLGLMPEHRYWSAGYAVVAAGAIMAKHLGLIDFDIQRILQWIENQKIAMVERIKYTVLTSEESFGMMLKDIGPGLLITDIEGGKSHKNTAFVLQEPRGPMTGRVIVDTGIALIAQPVINAWCSKNKTDSGAMMFAANRAGWLISEEAEKRYPGKGTNYTMGQIRCFSINWAALESSASINPQLADVIQLFDKKAT